MCRLPCSLIGGAGRTFAPLAYNLRGYGPRQVHVYVMVVGVCSARPQALSSSIRHTTPCERQSLKNLAISGIDRERQQTARLGRLSCGCLRLKSGRCIRDPR
jgi:hypothetical protein